MKFGFTIFLILASTLVFAQDPQSSQLYSSPLLYNPGFAGSAGCSRAFLGYRNQWPAISGTFVTYNFTYDQRVNFLHGGVGLRVMHDRAGEGTLKTWSVSGVYSFQFKIADKITIAPGIEFGLVNKSIDFSKLTFGDMIDPRYGFIYSTTTTRPASGNRNFFDLSAGLTAYSKTFFAGFSANHLTQPKEGNSSSRLPIRLTAIAGADFKLAGIFGMMPCVLYQQQQNFQSLIFNQNFRIAFAVIGAGLRANFYNFDSMIFTAGVQFKPVRVFYSYDLTVSKLSNNTAGSHELSVSFKFNCKNKQDKIISPRYWGG